MDAIEDVEDAEDAEASKGFDAYVPSRTREDKVEDRVKIVKLLDYLGKLKLDEEDEEE